MSGSGNIGISFPKGWAIPAAYGSPGGSVYLPRKSEAKPWQIVGHISYGGITFSKYARIGHVVYLANPK